MSIEVERIMAEYREQQELYRRLGPRLEDLLDSLLQDTDVRVLSINMRVKEEASLRRKVENRPGRYSRLNDVTDILGLRIITYRSGEVDSVAEIVIRQFDIDPTNSIDKRTTLADDQFGYLSLHYVASLSSGRLILPEYMAYAGCKFEIQIRSVLQHTWAQIEHDIGYKPDVDLPAGMRRRFSRIAGLLEVADEEFNRIVIELEEYRQFTVNDFSWKGEELYVHLKAKGLPTLKFDDGIEIRQPPDRNPIALARYVRTEAEDLLCRITQVQPIFGGLLQILKQHRDNGKDRRDAKWIDEDTWLTNAIMDLDAVLVGRMDSYD